MRVQKKAAHHQNVKNKQNEAKQKIQRLSQSSNKPKREPKANEMKNKTVELNIKTRCIVFCEHLFLIMILYMKCGVIKMIQKRLNTHFDL